MIYVKLCLSNLNLVPRAVGWVGENPGKEVGVIYDYAEQFSDENVKKHWWFSTGVSLSFKVIHLTRMERSGWLITSWIINEFEKSSFFLKIRLPGNFSRGTQRLILQNSVRRSKYCLGFSIAWAWLKFSRWPFHSWNIFEPYPNSLWFSKV